MGKHNETGRLGEQIAAEYLAAKGWNILHRNWRSAHRELDLIALDEQELVFIEIKTRSGTAFGFPEEAVSPPKQAHLRAAAEDFLEQNPEFTQARFDVVSILLHGNIVHEILHLRDAF
ncbi:MAG: YraN family protein [Bacteroidetes bacterium]|nr:YraN family protein [Bacteroidota bacterium]MBS1629695.1 YraN family protein [Bacteroidota bacterium]